VTARRDFDRIGGKVDTLVAERATWGVISSAELRECGLTYRMIERRVHCGRLHRVHRGVYAVGHPVLAARAAAWAAVLATAGWLSHRWAAATWHMITWPLGPVHIVTTTKRRSTPTLRVHHSRTLTLDDLTHDPQHGLPVTTPMRTLQDCAATETPHRLERLCHRADHLRLIDANQTGNSRRLKDVLQSLVGTGPQITRNDFEELFLEIVANASLPQPLVNHIVLGEEVDFYWPEHRLVNHIVLGEEVDFYWPEHRLIVETDGAATHLTRAAFENDRRRDAKLTRAGYRVIRFTWWQLTNEPGLVAATVRDLLYAAS